MLHVLGSILAGIGSVLLILLLVLAVLILCLLFTPFFYGGRVTKQGDSLEAGAQISWLFRLLYVKVRYRDKKAETEIYILGIPLLRIRKYLSRWKKKKMRKRPVNSRHRPTGSLPYRREERLRLQPMAERMRRSRRRERRNGGVHLEKSGSQFKISVIKSENGTDFSNLVPLRRPSGWCGIVADGY